MKKESFPKLLLITEAVFVNDSVGASRTLQNLLKSYPSENILLLSPKDSFKRYNYLPPFNKNNLFFSFYLFYTIKNRLAPFINPLIEKLNLLWMEFQPINYSTVIKNFKPDVILAVPLFKEGMVITRRMIAKNKIPAYVYLMDDWVTTNKASWFINDLQKTTGEVLRNSKWLMISPDLRDCFASFYQISNPECIVVHNPVDIKPYTKNEPLNGRTFRIAYAGSIWDMHKDALFLVAKAVKALEMDGHQIELVLYCQEKFYTADQSFWNQNATSWGGLISYESLNGVLKMSDLLLVTTAFSEKVSTLVKTSVLTKTTDYMNAGRPMLALGPPYSATNRFVREYKVGYVIDTENIETIKQELQNIMNSEEQNEALAYSSWLKLKEHFSEEVINKTLIDFINN